MIFVINKTFVISYFTFTMVLKYEFKIKVIERVHYKSKSNLIYVPYFIN
jgi:hypothetical protein